ncbi:MAG: hypothetical protein J6U04_08390 [Salinivirgaceae bacterium]|nr:hypothetical protein [Salinivirgaceae bacterium]
MMVMLKPYYTLEKVYSKYYNDNQTTATNSLTITYNSINQLEFLNIPDTNPQL